MSLRDAHNGVHRGPAEAAFAAAIRAEAGLQPGPVPALRPGVRPPAARPDDVDLGALDTGGPFGFDLDRLLEGRLLIQGASGAGKSWTLRRLLEQSAGRVQQIVVDPEGEFRTLADRFSHVVLDGAALDTAALGQTAARAREHRVSLVLDLSDLERERQMQAVTPFLVALVEAPREQWHPVIVAIDEVHLFAPFGGQSGAAASIREGAIDAVTDLMSRGRKRGLCGILSTQRLARMAKSVVSEVHNFLIGLNTLDLDIRRAAETIGWDARRAFDRLPMLRPGEFVAVGQSFSRSPAVARIGPVQTLHRGETPRVGISRTLSRSESLSRRYRETLSATGASKILGCDSKTVTELCLAGTLVATRRGTQRLPQQGGDVWAIQPAALRQYVLRHLERVDFRRVDKFAVVALLVGADVLAAAAGLQSDVREAS